MSEIDQLQTPLTELEVAELSSAASKGLTGAGMLLLRRLAFERSTLRAALAERDTELARLRDGVQLAHATICATVLGIVMGAKVTRETEAEINRVVDALAALLPPTPKEG